MKLKTTFTLGALLALLFIPVRAAEPTLRVGDAAPPLQVGRWVQGEPVKEFRRDRVYLVEFWATWCGPCRTSIPHVNDLHRQLEKEGLVVIGQDVWEDDTTLVEPFVKGMGGKMQYRVALDLVPEGSKGRMAETWMDAAGRTGIPSAFLVDKSGRIVWIGHPMELEAKLVQQVLAGTFDLAKAIAAQAEEARNKEQLTALWRDFSEHKRAEKWDLAEADLKRITELTPEARRQNLEFTRLDLLFLRREYKAAHALAARLSEARSEDAGRQNNLAWMLATREDIAERDLDLAEQIARRGQKASDGANAELHDTLARVLFLEGRKDEAIEWQRKAVQQAEGARRSQFEKNLDDYAHGRVPQEGKVNALLQRLSREKRAADWAAAGRTLDEVEPLVPKVRLPGLALDRFGILLGQGEVKPAYALARELGQRYKDNENLLNSLAWEIATRKDLEPRDLDLARDLALRADEVAGGASAAILDTLARVRFMRGEKEAAIAAQKKAVEKATARSKAEYQDTLDAYLQGTLPPAE